ncbi:MAG TPA: amidohydrolase, partial [Mycobacterium sp.]|nr:amidohydrolase [Mycobacterium sp.]
IARIRAVSDGIARTYGMPEDRLPMITMKGHSGPLVNDDDLTARLATALKARVGEQNVLTEFPPATGSEDCHLLKGPHSEVPLAYLLVGVADPGVYAAAAAAGKLFPYTPHAPDYIVDLAAIPFGTKVAGYAMLELLAAR